MLALVSGGSEKGSVNLHCLRKPVMALMSHPCVALSSLTVKHRHYIILFTKIFILKFKIVLDMGYTLLLYVYHKN